MKLFNGMLGLIWLFFGSVANADNFAYIASGTSGQQLQPELSVVNVNTGQLVTTIVLPERAPAIAVIPNSTGSHVYVVASSQTGNSYIHTVDARLNKVVGTTVFSVYDGALGSGIVLDAAILSKDDRWLILASNPTATLGSYGIFIIDLKNGGQRYKIYTPNDSGSAQSIAISPDGKFVTIVRSNYWAENVTPIGDGDGNNIGSFISRVTLFDLERVVTIIDTAITQNQDDPTNTTIEFLRANGMAGDSSFRIPEPAVRLDADPNNDRETASAGIVISADPIDPENNPLRVFVANSWADTVSVLKIAKTADSNAWLASLENPNPLDDRIKPLYQQFPSTFQIEQAADPIAFDADDAPYGVAISPDNKTLYATMSRRWKTAWNTSETPFDGSVKYVNVEYTNAPGTPIEFNLYFWAPANTTFHPRAISVVESSTTPGEITLAFIKNIVGSSTNQGTLDGYYLSIVHVISDTIHNTKTFTEVANILVNSSAKAPIFFNGDFVGEDCDNCPVGPTAGKRTRLNPPTAMNPWLVLFGMLMLLYFRHFYTTKR